MWFVSCSCLLIIQTGQRKSLQVTDIPDWCFIEVLGPGRQSREAARFPVPWDVLKRMHDASPIAHVDKVQVPVLMFLGAKDRRVPHIDGHAYADALRCVYCLC